MCHPLETENVSFLFPLTAFEDFPTEMFRPVNGLHVDCLLFEVLIDSKLRPACRYFAMLLSVVLRLARRPVPFEAAHVCRPPEPPGLLIPFPGPPNVSQISACSSLIPEDYLTNVIVCRVGLLIRLPGKHC